MPHLILDYSHNVIEQDDLNSLIAQIHTILTEKLPTQLSSCKSRSIARDDFYVGDGNPQNAFVHMNLKVMPGRTPDVLQTAGQAVLNAATDFFADSAKALNLQITLELMEASEHYFRAKLP